MRPNYGSIVSLDGKKLVKIDEDTQYSYKYTGGTVRAPNGIRCAVFTDDSGKLYMQPWAVAGFFRRFGEKNIGAYLKNEQVIEMVKAYHLEHAKIQDLATKYNITENHCRDIVTGKAWRHITIGLIRQLHSGGHEAVVVSNKPAVKQKLSPAILPYVRRDIEVNKLSLAEVAAKYCISERHARRIASGQAWKQSDEQ